MEGKHRFNPSRLLHAFAHSQLHTRRLRLGIFVNVRCGTMEGGISEKDEVLGAGHNYFALALA